eukprot:6884105-Prymnesium_polylepis.1
MLTCPPHSSTRPLVRAVGTAHPSVQFTSFAHHVQLRRPRHASWQDKISAPTLPHCMTATSLWTSLHTDSGGHAEARTRTYGHGQARTSRISRTKN